MNIDLKYTRPQLDIFFGCQDIHRYVIVAKGRRFGATHGAAHACIEWGFEGKKILWGDTVQGNIDRYVDRFFRPGLSGNKLAYTYNTQKKELKFECGRRGVIDFRSADRPENWEGFGYDIIILNEAGIILKNPYLYTNAVLPMMLDSPTARLFALGAPKGKLLKTGAEHPFYTLFKQRASEKHRILQYTSYDNPLIRPEDIAALEDEISLMRPEMVRQEIYGEFIDVVTDALFTSASIARNRIDNTPGGMVKTVLAVDPAVSSGAASDETGLVVAAIDVDRRVYILGDYSGRYKPDEWGRKVAEIVKKHDIDEVVCEVNQGGDLVSNIIQMYSPAVYVRKIRAFKGKSSRAEPVAALYEQDRIKHVGYYPVLEGQMTSWDGSPSAKSPDRMDALVYAVTRLAIGGREIVAL